MNRTAGEVRRAGVDDADEIAAVLHAFNTEFDTPTPRPDVLAARLRILLATSTTFALLAGDPAVALALVTLRPSVWYDGPIATLDEMYVAPHLRGQGIGSEVLRVFLKEAETRGVSAIEINVDESDVDAQRFYERNGYSGMEPDTGERAFYFFRELNE